MKKTYWTRHHNSKAIAKLLIDKACDLGFDFYLKKDQVEEAITHKDGGLCFHNEPDRKGLCYGFESCYKNDGYEEYYSNGCYEELSLDDFIKMMEIPEPKVITVKLNEEYEAKVTKDGVVIGCQTFTHEAIMKVYDAIVAIERED